MNSIDPFLMQRLVDGELDANATRELLVAAENAPQLWRDIAVRFVEETTWQRAFRNADGFAPPVIDPLASVETTANETTSDAELAAQDAVTFNQKTTANVNPPLNPAQGAGWSRGLVLAAAIMVAITGGFMAGKGIDFGGATMPPTDGLAVTDVAPANDSHLADNTLDDVTENQLTTTPVSYEPDFHMQLTDQFGNPVMKSDVPMYGQQNARKMGVLNTRRLPVEFVRRVSDSGYGIDQNTNFISGQLNDGRRFVVPIRTINLNPGL